MSDEWAPGEVTRALTRLSAALEKFEDSVQTAFSDLDGKYVRREVFEQVVSQIKERQSSAHSWVQQIVAPLVTGVVVALVMWAVTSVRR